MESAKHFMSTVVFYTLGATLAFLLLYGTAQMGAYVPLLEGTVSPTVSFRPTKDITRIPHDARWSTGRVCFTLPITKLMNGVPTPWRFTVKTAYSGRINVAAYLADTRDNRLPDQGYGHPHAVGVSWDRRYCFELPGTIGDADELLVEGTAFHIRHPMFDTATPVPPFTVHGVKSNQDTP